jgi:hypothetical protein
MSKLPALVLLSLSMVGGLSAQAPAAPQPSGPGSWHCADNGDQPIAQGVSTAKTYRVTNNGPDTSITVYVKDETGKVIKTSVLVKDDSVDMGVPAGGSIWVGDGDGGDDPMKRGDADSLDATGTYEIV